MKRVLVLGATGFVGGHVLKALAQSPGCEVIPAVRDASALPRAFQAGARVGDLRSADHLARLLRGIDVVVHAAAWSALWGHEQRSRSLFLEPSLALLKAAKSSNVQRILFPSSVSVAEPSRANDADAPGVERRYWPHERHLVQLENALEIWASHGRQATVLRLGYFVGPQYGLGILPVLLPKLRRRIVPWIEQGHMPLPLIDGRDVGRAFKAAVDRPQDPAYLRLNIVGPTVPTFRELVQHLHQHHTVPMPLANVSYRTAHAVGWLMEKINPLQPGDPLLTRSLVHLLRPRNLDNQLAADLIGYKPCVAWQRAIDEQMLEIAQRSGEHMRMYSPLPGELSA